MSKIRSDIKSSLVDHPDDLFDIEVDKKEWKNDPKSRMGNPEVKELWKNTHFRDDANKMVSDDVDDQHFSVMWTHQCIVVVSVIPSESTDVVTSSSQ